MISKGPWILSAGSQSKDIFSLAGTRSEVDAGGPVWNVATTFAFVQKAIPALFALTCCLVICFMDSPFFNLKWWSTGSLRSSHLHCLLPPHGSLFSHGSSVFSSSGRMVWSSSSADPMMAVWSRGGFVLKKRSLILTASFQVQASSSFLGQGSNEVSARVLAPLAFNSIVKLDHFPK